MEKNTHKEIVNIKRELKDLKETVDLSLLLNPDALLDYVIKCLGKSKDRIRVFLAINGTSSLKDISKKMPDVNVPRASKYLERKRLIYKIDVPGRSYVYNKPHWVRIINIENKLRKDFGISDE